MNFSSWEQRGPCFPNAVAFNLASDQRPNLGKWDCITWPIKCHCWFRQSNDSSQLPTVDAIDATLTKCDHPRVLPQCGFSQEFAKGTELLFITGIQWWSFNHWSFIPLSCLHPEDLKAAQGTYFLNSITSWNEGDRKSIWGVLRPTNFDLKVVEFQNQNMSYPA